jgi:hypothetical protein
VRDFLKAIGGHWVRFIMGSAPFAVIAIAAGLAFPVPPWLYGAAVLLGLLNAAYGVWKDERAKVEALKGAAAGAVQTSTPALALARKLMAQITEIKDRSRELREALGVITYNPDFPLNERFSRDWERLTTLQREFLVTTSEAELLFDRPVVDTLHKFVAAARGITFKHRREDLDAAFNVLHSTGVAAADALRTIAGRG